MEDFKGKKAFITGGASGIGLAIARELLNAGADVVIADIRKEALDKAVEVLAGGKNLRAVHLDVTDRAAFARVADEVGKVHLLVSNAGIFLGGPTQDATFDDWDFCLGVNLGGTVNCVRTFVPRMIAQGEGGHIVLTSSINGLFASGGVGPYTASKFATTAIGECLRMNLASHGIGVSILCPGPVATGLFESTPAVRPENLSDTGAHLVALDETDPVSQEIFAGAMSIEEVGAKVMQGLRRNDLYIVTHTEIRDVLEARMKALLAALPDEPIPPARAKSARMLYDVPPYAEQSAKPAPGPSSPVYGGGGSPRSGETEGAPTTAPRSPSPASGGGSIGENETIVRRFFEEGLNSDNLEKMRAFFHPDATWTPMAKTNIPGMGTHRGRTGIVDEFLAPVRGLFVDGDPQNEIISLIGKDDLVAVETHGTGKFKNGRDYDNRYAWIVEIRDGMIFAIREYMDTAYIASITS